MHLWFHSCRTHPTMIQAALHLEWADLCIEDKSLLYCCLLTRLVCIPQDWSRFKCPAGNTTSNHCSYASPRHSESRLAPSHPVDKISRTAQGLSSQLEAFGGLFTNRNCPTVYGVFEHWTQTGIPHLDNLSFHKDHVLSNANILAV